MKFIATIISLSLTAGAAVLPAAASFDQSSSDRDAWIEQALSSNNSHSGGSATAKKVSTAGGSLTASNGSNLARSVAGLFPGVRMRPFVPNRYLPSEHDFELATAQQQQPDSTAAAQLPPSTMQLAKAMAQTQAMNTAQHQLQGGTATAYTYTGGYSNAPARGRLLTAQSSRTTQVQSRVNALVPAIPEPMSSNETIGQIRSALRSNQSGQLIADASIGSTTYGANLYPDIVGPVPTQATANARSVPFPLSLLPQKTTRSYAYTGSGAGNRTNTSSSTSRSNNLPAATLGGWRTTQPAQQHAAQQFTNIQSQRPQQSQLSYNGFQSYTGKVHVQPPVMRQTQNARTGSGTGTCNTSSLPADCNIASTDNYSTNTTRVASYAPYSGIQSSSSLPY